VRAQLLAERARVPLNTMCSSRCESPIVSGSRVATPREPMPQCNRPYSRHVLREYGQPFARTVRRQCYVIRRSAASLARATSATSCARHRADDAAILASPRSAASDAQRALTFLRRRRLAPSLRVQ
jgi:hypothetical protein